MNDQPTTEKSFAEYTLDSLESHFHDALNEDDLSSSDIYVRIISLLMDSRNYHTKQLNKIEKLLDLMTGPRITPATSNDWKDFWEGDIGTF